MKRHLLRIEALVLTLLLVPLLLLDRLLAPDEPTLRPAPAPVPVAAAIPTPRPRSRRSRARAQQGAK